MNHTIKINGSDLKIWVDEYQPGVASSKKCYGIPYVLEWYADTGNRLFNDLIHDQYCMHEEIERKLIDAIEDCGREYEAEQKKDAMTCLEAS